MIINLLTASVLQVIVEFKKQLSTDISPDKGRKSISERPLLGDIMKEASTSSKYYLGR